VANRELVGEHLAHNLLLTSASRIHQLVECRRLFTGQPDKQWNTILRHARHDSILLSADIRGRHDIDLDHSRAAACFELAQHLQRAGHPEDAVQWFREAHRLAPENWTYKRQAWSLADPLQGPTDMYDSDWLTELQAVGAENYYAQLEL
jgi:Tetratricopeptide repeat